MEFIYTIADRPVSQEYSNPYSDIFDPLKAAIFHRNSQNINEAFWLTFLAIHFGKNLKKGWKLVREFYGSLGNDNNIWTWDRITKNQDYFNNWININYISFSGSYGNHRKYETLKPEKKRSPSNVISTYIEWAGNNHERLIQDTRNNEINPRVAFEALYKSMSNVASFGRTAKFDYLTMIAKLELTNIEPGKTFMTGATGPVKGARLLFGNSAKANISCAILEHQLSILEQQLSLGKMGMQVLEDSLCNWQKSPSAYKHFRG
ncbi:hypothetical protein MRS74_06875 [Marinobacterium sp. OS208]|nr:hypothetical protein [Marinobacterium sedimentorum]